MAISHQSMKKLFREHFPGDDPMRPDKSEQQELVVRIKQHFEGDEWVDTSKESWMSQEKRLRHLLSLHLKLPRGGYSYSTDSVRLLLDADGDLEIESSGVSARVSRLDEVFAFLLECKRRLERQRAQRKRREKVRQFKDAALVAQLKKIARQEKFDFTTEFTPQRIKLWIKLNETQVLEIFVFRKRFQEALDGLGAAIRSLRECWQHGLAFKTTNRRALPWRAEWIRYSDTDPKGTD